ncbi:phosphotransferase system mannose-type iia component [Lucifera butyrica]|uniref:Phosphotransferase system mannose-type iia component n=1 Tax=Lucifera butyrica TaxID=1351585 RepID=A0A498RAS0_9FIRM|nr:sigma-54-dependent transcriptional regulator [Lucifera butyrica]VBB07382.1 phosphotransferase system mannose-type iia component [Lucifera butyrica]
MKRIDKIYEYLEEYTQKLSKEDLLQNKGFDANELAADLNILRNNVSKELNELLRRNQIIKLRGRPVKFLHKAAIEKTLNIRLTGKSIEVTSIHDFLRSQEAEDPFSHLIGAEKSLKNQVEQAKAAIIYPPVGLHTLVVGQTGVGKTLFARMMYNYGKHIQRFVNTAPFIVFNCADYYNNPQLLLSHIFGHAKGAFTGADSEKGGLVEKANGGILFLDEIHRLPPEGQEMIFYFMDTGTYNKLGETERKRKASVLILGATTEDPTSSLLKTFIRRIPIIINIPSLQERTVEEKIDIIKYLFANEAHRINKPIKISSEVVKALIGSASYGNIGQLKSNIQLTCAKGFLTSIKSEKNYIELDFKALSANIKDGFFELSKNRREFEKLGGILNAPLLIEPDGYKELLEDSHELPFNLYRLIEDKVSLLKEEGLDDSYINRFITTDVSINIKKFYNKFNKDRKNRDRILKIVDKEILEFAEKMKDLAETDLLRKYSDRFVYALSFHLSAFFKRLKEEKYNDRLYISHSIQNDDAEFKVALKIKAMISQTFRVDVPEVEITYIAILLKSVEEEKQGQVGILVAAHGNSTASSMVSVAQKLLGDSSACAVDMPLDVSPREILDIIINKVKAMDSGKGVLLLVDMGSLFKFEATVIERTGTRVRTIDMVSTPLVLEAVRKSSIFNMELDDIYSSLKEFKGYNNEPKENTSFSDNVIITVCTSGKGTAIKLKEIVGEIVADLTAESYTIIPVGVKELDKKINDLQKNHAVLAVVGVKKPKANIPFIPLEKLIDGTGEKVLKEIIAGGRTVVRSQEQSIVVKDLCVDNLKQFLTYLNPHKVIGLLLDFVSRLERELAIEFDHSLKIRIVIHAGYALERMITNDGLTLAAEKSHFSDELIQAVNNACEIFQKSLNISLSDAEKYYICEMLI